MSSQEPSPELQLPNTVMRRDQHPVGNFLSPDLYDDVIVTPEVKDLTTMEINFFRPDKLKKICFARSLDEYKEPQRFDGVLLSAQEHTALVKSPDRLGRAALNRTLNRRDEQTDEVLAAADRSSDHALERKMVAMTKLKSGMEFRRADIAELREEFRNPNLAHKRQERVRQLFSASWAETLNLTDLIQLKSGFDDERKMRLRQSAKTYLTSGPPRNKAEKWKTYLDFQKGYLDRKLRIFSLQIAKTNEARQVDGPAQ